MKAIVSIHDVMPETIEKVEIIIKKLDPFNIPPFSLLTIPGKKWTGKSMGKLRKLSELGYSIVPHGWNHKSVPRKIFHKLHSAFISKDVAEHLDLKEEAILELMIRSRNWFIGQKLVPSSLYVPPAWALGQISEKNIIKAPFKQIEVTRGIIHIINHSSIKFQKLPLSGYEATNPFRVTFLNVWNKFQETHAEKGKLPLRISIHPRDFDLPLANQIKNQLSKVSTFLDYADLCMNLED